MHAACSTAFTDLQDTLGELDSRLSVGLTYDEYGDAVADARVAYDQVDIAHLKLPYDGNFICLGSVGVPLERALNQYAAAYDRWDECFDDYNCDVDAIQPELQTYWSKASRAITKAKDGLADMTPSVASSSS